MSSEKYQDAETKKIYAETTWTRKLGGKSNFLRMVDSGELVRVQNGNSGTDEVEPKKEKTFSYDDGENRSVNDFTEKQFIEKFSARYFRGAISSGYLKEVK